MSIDSVEIERQAIKCNEYWKSDFFFDFLVKFTVKIVLFYGFFGKKHIVQCSPVLVSRYVIENQKLRLVTKYKNWRRLECPSTGRLKVEIDDVIGSIMSRIAWNLKKFSKKKNFSFNFFTFFVSLSILNIFYENNHKKLFLKLEKQHNYGK